MRVWIVLGFYNFVFWLSWVYWPFFLRKRIKRGKEDPSRWQERLGKSTRVRGAEKIIWVNAVSVGEALAALPLIERLPTRTKEGLDIKVLLTTSTTTAALMVKDKLPAHAFHQYMVIDHPLYVRRFLAHWQPSAALWMESELWPNMIIQTAKASIPLILVNGRLSPKSVGNWQRVRFLSSALLQRFDICLAQDQRNLEALELLGASNVAIGGNLKYDALPLDLSVDEKEVKAWRNALGESSVFLAASTHKSEEETFIETHRALAQQGIKIKTIIAPRHPNRAAAVADMARAQDLKVWLFSKNASTPPDGAADIYIIDAIGVLGLFYCLASVVFMGGSFVPLGGQNPLEPARLDCALLSGASVFNFQEVYDVLEKNKGVQIIDRETLTQALADYFNAPDKIKTAAINAKQSAESLKGALDKTQAHLQPYLKI